MASSKTSAAGNRRNSGGGATKAGGGTATGPSAATKVTTFGKGSSTAAGHSRGSNRAKQQKDVGAPKRPLSAYMLFAKEKRAEVLLKQPELKSNFKEVGRILGELWRGATPTVKEHFSTVAGQEKIKYGQAVAAYKQHKY